MRNLSRVVVILVLSFLPLFVQAATPLDIVINEIAWMGTKVEGIESKNWWRYEWLELYNNTNQPISLNGWKIELYRTDLDWTLELNGTIGAQNYFLIVASDKIFPNYDLNYSNLKGKFINSGQKVLLKDKDGKIIDEIDCSNGWFAGDNTTKQTMERINSLLKSDFDNWGTSQNPGGTPKTPNSVVSKIIELQPPEEPIGEAESKTEPLQEPQPEPSPEPITYPSGILINEFLPSPIGPDEKEEWIEIYNQNDFEVDLSNWQITDTEGKTNIYTFLKGTKISAQGFLVLSRATTEITLNNDGDGLNLIQPDGKIIDSVSYEKAPHGQSYSRIDSKWTWSSTLTPGSANIIPDLVSEEAKLYKEGTKEPAPKGETKKQPLEKELVAIGAEIPKATPFFLLLIIALAIAISFGIIILILKRKIKTEKL